MQDYIRKANIPTLKQTKEMTMHIRDYPTLKDELVYRMVNRGITEPADFNVFTLSLVHQYELTDVFIGDMEDSERLELIFDDIDHPDSFEKERSLGEVVNALRLNINNHMISKISDTFLDQMQGALDQHYKSQGEPSRIYGD